MRLKSLVFVAAIFLIAGVSTGSAQLKKVRFSVSAASNRLAYSGDYMPSYPSGGIGVTDEIKTSPNDVFAFVKGSVRGLQFARQNRAEAKKISFGLFQHQGSSLERTVLRALLEPPAGRRFSR